MKKFKIYASKIEYEEEDDKVKIFIKENTANLLLIITLIGQKKY